MKKKYEPKLAYDGRYRLNLGCGEQFHLAWTNIDFFPKRFLRYKYLTKMAFHIRAISKESFERIIKVYDNVYFWDLYEGIPFNDNIFNVVYHSHFLEHLERDKAYFFLQECWRVLKDYGILRVVVPDLHKLILDYLSAYNNLKKGKENAIEAHELSIINLIDQMVRNKPGGQMAKGKNVENKKHVNKIFTLLKKILRGHPTAYKTGELHKWMYDRFALRVVLERVGFSKIKEFDAFHSYINDWNSYYLDSNYDGSIYKQGSIYMEGVKLPRKIPS